MILTCPNCSARFMIDGGALGPTGRTVRCGACGHSWLQLPEQGGPETEPEQAAAPEAALAMAQAGAAAAAAAAEAAAKEEDRGKRRSRRRVMEPEAEPEDGARRKRGFARVLVWFAFVFVLTAIVLGGIQYRQEIVRIWPPAFRLYQALGLDVEPVSGQLLRVPQDSIKFRRETEGGTPILVVSGEILNESKKAQRVTPMRIDLLDKENRVLRTERIKLDDQVLDPGKKLPFQTSIPNYPPEAVAVRITFDVMG
jgi:predicted Zn finger-like uncharacterized protein